VASMESVTAPHEQVIRPRPWLVVAAVTAALLFLVGTLLSLRASGWDWVTVALAAMAGVGVLGVLEMATTRVLLSGETLEIRHHGVRRRFAARDLRSVRWEKGAGVALELAEGGWARLPEMGHDPRALAGTLRAWHRRWNPPAGGRAP